MTGILDLFALAPVRWGLGAVVISGLGLPLAGVALVGLDILPLRFAVMHLAFLGAAVGLLLGLEPMACALILCALAGGAMAPLADRPAGLSGAVGLLMSAALALALLVLSLSGVHAAGAFELLWGSVLAVRPMDVAVLALLATGLGFLFWRRRRQLALLFYDREMALVSGVAVPQLTLLLLVTASLALAGAIRLTGAVLVDGVTLLPALAARNLNLPLGPTCLWAVTFGLVGNLAGFFLALALDLPVGPVLTLCATAITLMTFAVRRD